ncbi:MAG: hypothetical protein ABEJ28_03380 [Salinigranum sp.]
MAVVSSAVAVAGVVVVVLLGAFVWEGYVGDWFGRYVVGSEGDERTTYVRDERPGGIRYWLTTVNHRDIGVMYAVFSVFSFGVAGAMALIMRTELLTPKSVLSFAR